MFLEITDDVYINADHISKISFEANGSVIVEVDCKCNYVIDDSYYIREIKAFVSRNEWCD